MQHADIVQFIFQGGKHGLVGFECIRCLPPGETLRPVGHVGLVRKSHSILAVTSGKSFYDNSILRSGDTSRRITKINFERPGRYVFEQALKLPIIPLSVFVTFGKNRPTVASGNDVNDQGFRSVNEYDLSGAINERLETFNLVQ